jgi:hypothetical protein
MIEQVEEAIKIVEQQRNSLEVSSMSGRDSELVLKCLYKLFRILEIRELFRSEHDEYYD